MLARNLGNIERVIRLLMGLALLAWAVTRSDMNAMEWFVVVIATFLIMNGIFARCYLWYILEVDTHTTESGRRSAALC